MRIAYLINGLNGGGASFPMTLVIGLMRELGHEVQVLALMLQDGKAASRLETAGIPCRLVGRGSSDVFLPAVRLLRELRRFRPDVIWTSLTRGTIYGQLIGRSLGIPVVSWQHSAFLKPGNVRVLRRLRDLTSHWVADSDSVRDFAQHALGIDSGRITVWTPFVASPDAPSGSPWDGREPVRLGTVGRLHVSKQYPVLLEAFARARQLFPAAAGSLELHIAGDGPEEANLKALARRLQLDGCVRFAGFVERPCAFLATLHGYVQSSMKEGFCLAAHEAMQAGLPVIATRVGELVNSVCPGRTGWLCEVGDTEGLARAIGELASDPARAAERGAAARDWLMRRYSVEVFRSTGRHLLERVREELRPGQSRMRAFH